MGSVAEDVGSVEGHADDDPAVESWRGESFVSHR